MAGGNAMMRLELLKFRQDSLAPDDVITELNPYFCVGGQVNIGTGAELNKADTFTALYWIAGFYKGYNSAGQDAGDQADHDSETLRIADFKPQENIFIMDGGGRFERIKKLAGAIFEERHLSSHGRILDVNVNHGKKHGNTLAFAAHEFGLVCFVDNIDFAVSGKVAFFK